MTENDMQFNICQATIRYEGENLELAKSLYKFLLKNEDPEVSLRKCKNNYYFLRAGRSKLTRLDSLLCITRRLSLVERHLS